MAEILAVCISEKKGEQKHPVDQVELKENWGIVGDAHAGCGRTIPSFSAVSAR